METKTLLEMLSRSINFEEQQGAKKYQHIVPFRKPSNDIYIRVNPDLKWRSPASLHKEAETGDFYFISAEVIPLFNGSVAPYTIYSAITRQGDFLLWPIRIEESLTRQNNWISSGHKIAKQAEDKWLKISSNHKTQSYEAYVAQGEIPEPIWPEEGFEQMLDRAFKDRMVMDTDHPLIRKINGVFK